MTKGRKTPKGKDVDRVLAIEERRQKVVALRRRGASLADIGRTLDVTPDTVRKDLDVTLSAAAHTHSAREAVTMELERLDRMLFAVYQDAIEGDDKKIATVLRIMERRAKYLGLDAEPERDASAPVTINVNPALFPPAVQERLTAQAETPIEGEEADK